MQDLSSQPGIEPEPPAVEVWNPNHWTTRGFPAINFSIHKYKKRNKTYLEPKKKKTKKRVYFMDDSKSITKT